MKFNLNKIPIYFFTLLILLIVIFIFTLKIIKLSTDFQEKELISSNIYSEIKVYENTNGIPHIIANSELDVYFALGYYHAKDRLWQMDFYRRYAQGRLSEIFGEKLLETDLFMRGINFEEIANKSFDSASVKSKKILKKYSDGINFYIEKFNHRLPFEFGTLSYKPEKWTEKDSYLISKLLTFELSFSFWLDLLYSQIVYKLDNIRAADFLNFKSNNIVVNSNDDIKDFSNIDFLTLVGKLPINTSNGGSNSWAVNSVIESDTLTMLANDPHLTIGVPSRWYQAHLTSENLNVTGYSIPGIPGIIIGRNDSVAWGITNMMADICDLYLINKIDDDYYISKNGEKTKFRFTRDTILIKNRESHIYYKKETNMSTILSDVHLWKNNKNKFFENFDICFDWTAKYTSDEFLSLHNLNKSGNAKDIDNSLKDWSGPPLIFNYITKDREIGKLAAGILPVRTKTNPNLLNPYSDNEYHWQGFYNANSIISFQKDNKIIVSANEDISNSSVKFISNYWEPNSRFDRIKSYLSEKTNPSMRDMQIIQLDNYSPYAKELLQIVKPTLEDYYSELNNQEKILVDKLLNWNYIISKELNESLLYIIFIKNLIELTYKDELGERLYKQFTFISNRPYTSILNSLYSNSILFDDITTEEIENKDIIIIYAIKKTISELKDKFGKELFNYKLADYKYLQLNHIFSNENFFSPSLSLGPFPMGGDNTTIYNTETRITNTDSVIISASMRFISEINDSIIYTVIPGGSSGDPMSSNYSDQIQLWLNGGYIRLNSSRFPDKNSELKTSFVRP